MNGQGDRDRMEMGMEIRMEVGQNGVELWVLYWRSWCLNTLIDDQAHRVTSHFIFEHLITSSTLIPWLISSQRHIGTHWVKIVSL